MTLSLGNLSLTTVTLSPRNLKMAANIKVIQSEEYVPQHKLLNCELTENTKTSSRTIFSETSLLEAEGTNSTKRV